MNVSSTGSSTSVLLSALPAQANDVQQTRRETRNDGDQDNGTPAAKAPAPTVNLNGQKVGGLINVTA